MATTLNAGTTAATALNVTTDTTGAMAIQTSGTTAIAISTAQVVSLTNALLPASGGTGITSLGTGVATFLGTPSSANLAAALTDETGTGANVFAGSPTLTGTPLAPTASPSTNTTQIATTAFVGAAVTAATGSLGTMSTQNANAVAITGGTVVGITDLAIADGGTGASTAANARTNLGLGSLATLSAVGTTEITNASVTPAKLNGAQSGSAPIYGVRAWGQLNNTTIVGSGNIASVSFGGSDYTVTFTTAMPDANYSVVGSHNNSNGDIYYRPFTITSISAGSFSFSVSAGSTSTIICFQVIR